MVQKDGGGGNENEAGLQYATAASCNCQSPTTTCSRPLAKIFCRVIAIKLK